jgi:hypothetical protein
VSRLIPIFQEYVIYKVMKFSVPGNS